MHDDREHRTELNHDLESARRLVVLTEQVPRENEVPRRGHRQIFGEPLDDA